jgi:hypothetical protein
MLESTAATRTADRVQPISRPHGFASGKKEGPMETLVVIHEVDDVQHWLGSPKRKELFGPRGISVRPFHDPEGSNRVAVLVETPSIAAWREVLETDEAAEAMKHDGVHPETILGLVEG